MSVRCWPWTSDKTVLPFISECRYLQLDSVASTRPCPRSWKKRVKSGTVFWKMTGFCCLPSCSSWTLWSFVTPSFRYCDSISHLGLESAQSSSLAQAPFIVQGSSKINPSLLLRSTYGIMMLCLNPIEYPKMSESVNWEQMKRFYFLYKKCYSVLIIHLPIKNKFTGWLIK